MSDLDKAARIGEITAVRANIKANPALHIELLAAIVRTLREHGVHPDKRIVSDLTVAVSDELTSELKKEVVLPGGTNCSTAI